MAEHSRRDFLKLGAVTTSVVATSGVVSNEVRKSIEGGVVTESGYFVPLYENHNIGIDVDDIPSDADVFFRECTISSIDRSVTALNVSVRQLLEIDSTVYKGSNYESRIRVFPEEVLRRISQSEIEIMVGDIDDPESTIDTVRLGAMLDIITAGSGITGSLVAKRQARQLTNSSISRRNVLRLLSLTSISVAGWGATGFLINCSIETGKRQDALKRVYARFNGIISNIHPENTGIFFRNAVMALKMSLVADSKGSTNSVIPKIAYNVENRHSGIEDFLQLGPEFCRLVILAYPTDYLRKVVKSNGGIDMFCRSRLLKLPSNFQITDGVISEESLGSISDRFVDDEILKSELHRILDRSRNS